MKALKTTISTYGWRVSIINTSSSRSYKSSSSSQSEFPTGGAKSTFLSHTYFLSAGVSLFASKSTFISDFAFSTMSCCTERSNKNESWGWITAVLSFLWQNEVASYIALFVEVAIIFCNLARSFRLIWDWWLTRLINDELHQTQDLISWGVSWSE